MQHDTRHPRDRGSVLILALVLTTVLSLIVIGLAR